MSRLPIEKGIIGKKIGMTQIFTENGSLIPVTIVEAGPCAVVQKKTAENDKYSALQLGFIEKAERKSTKPEKGHFKKANVSVKRHLKEFKFKNAETYNVGDKVSADIFAAGEKVDVTGTSKGHGFTGVVKRWNHATQSEGHGVGPIHRSVGSMGANSDPSRVMKNKKMAGQYGHERVTVLNLEVIKIDAAKNIIAVRGAIPGARGSIVFVRSTLR